MRYVEYIGVVSCRIVWIIFNLLSDLVLINVGRSQDFLSVPDKKFPRLNLSNQLTNSTLVYSTISINDTYFSFLGIKEPQTRKMNFIFTFNVRKKELNSQSTTNRI